MLLLHLILFLLYDGSFEKESDIAILRTFGATHEHYVSIYGVAPLSVLGTLFGLIGGCYWFPMSMIVNSQDVFHVQLLSSNVYFVNYLPSEILFSDVSKICFASLFLSLIATVYPAWRASKMDPVESLRYE